MPYYWPRYQRNYWRRRRFRRRRFRGTFRRRRQRKYRVRNLKLKRITVREWQPPCIRNCKIRGLTCLVLFNPKRLGYNSTLYEESIVPQHWPGGGSFCVTQFSLDALYDLHRKCRNWWTTSNEDLPLCRYLGCNIRLYQCEETDYIVQIKTQLPSNSNKLTYPSCQPFMMQMFNNKIIVPSRKHRTLKKPYISMHIPPPPQLKTQWYFQTDIFKTPLIQIHATATSLTNTFQKPDQDSYCVTFPVLNTSLIQNREMLMQQNIPWPYKKGGGTLAFYMYYYEGTETDTSKFKLIDLIPLANIQQNKPGEAYTHLPPTTPIKQWITDYPQHWGNIFYHEHLENQEHYYYSVISPTSIWNKLKENQDNEQTVKSLTWSSFQPQHENVLTKLTEPIYYYLQYNPFKDTGQDSQLYLLSNQTGHGWDPPTDEDIILSGFPIWILFFGYLDFQIRLKKLTNIDTKCIMVLQSNFTQKPHPLPIVIINDSFLKGNSPYEQQCLPADYNKWYPQVQYQTMTMNNILQCGPGTPYITTKAENINMYYSFHWKWGGSPPKHVTVENPAHQAVYPVPRNQYETTSLQSPTRAPESILYSFDYRHGNITAKALERISKDWRTQTLISSITEPERAIQLETAFKTLETQEEEEHQTQTKILKQLHDLRLQQQSLRKHIISLMQKQSM
nr:MAG: ORF1 [TTV-like mini virus]